MFAGEWFKVNYKSDQNREFLEYCYYYDTMNQVVSVIWDEKPVFPGSIILVIHKQATMAAFLSTEQKLIACKIVL